MKLADAIGRYILATVGLAGIASSLFSHSGPIIAFTIGGLLLIYALKLIK